MGFWSSGPFLLEVKNVGKWKFGAGPNSSHDMCSARKVPYWRFLCSSLLEQLQAIYCSDNKTCHAKYGPGKKWPPGPYFAEKYGPPGQFWQQNLAHPLILRCSLIFGRRRKLSTVGRHGAAGGRCGSCQSCINCLVICHSYSIE